MERYYIMEEGKKVFACDDFIECLQHHHLCGPTGKLFRAVDDRLLAFKQVPKIKTKKDQQQ